MKKQIALLLFLFLSITGHHLLAQSASINGKVTEYESGESVLFGAVALYKQGNLVKGTETDFDGNYTFSNLDPGTYSLEFSYLGLQTTRIEGIQVFAGKILTINTQLESSLGITLDEIVVIAYKVPLIEQDNTTQSGPITADQIRSLPTRNINAMAATAAGVQSSNNSLNVRGSRDNATYYYIDGVRVQGELIAETPVMPKATENKKTPETTEFGTRTENPFQEVQGNRFSTFGVDVDRAAYSLVRSYVDREQLPPADAVRTEELINYFEYDYSQPEAEVPFHVQSELGVCPWNADHLLLSVGLQGEALQLDPQAPSNLTFLLDVSGSMGAANKLPLVKSSLLYLLDQLQPTDRIAIVVYASATGLVLPSTPVSERETIIAALERLRSGGSTAGGAGIKLAYETARANYRLGGNNRVILASDGDFNVGVSHPDSLEALIVREKDTGVFLTTLGFGMGNYKDNRMERLANKGNGMYAYIDNQMEAEKVFGSELYGSLYTIAKDVKLQLRFNQRDIASYRLIGYENRLLNKGDFADDSKDAGDIGAGHSVTALYELVPAKAAAQRLNVGRLALRYKTPTGHTSQLLNHQLASNVQDATNTSDNFRWAAAVTAYSLLVQNSEYKGKASYKLVASLGNSALGDDPYRWRAAFLEQAERTRELAARLGVR